MWNTMAQKGTWRENILIPGKRYRILKDWSFWGSYFKTGSIVKYESSGYERYDSETLYRFYEENETKTELIWRLRDDAPENIAKEYFCELDTPLGTYTP